MTELELERVQRAAQNVASGLREFAEVTGISPRRAGLAIAVLLLLSPRPRPRPPLHIAHSKATA